MKRSRRFVLAALIASIFAGARLLAVTFTVTSANDSGAGSLRQAILDANGNPGNDDIAFAIPGGGVHTIALASGLPPITQPVLIDGFTQTGATINTQPVGQGLNSNLTIEIDGSGAVSEPCFQVFAGNDDLLVMLIQGLVVNRCAVGAIHIGTGGDGTLVTGNFLGTDPAGSSVPGPQGFGVRVENALHVAIGGNLTFERNLISGHTEAGVVTQVAAFMAIRGNLIGTNAAGTAPIADDIFGDGLRLDVAAFVEVGGDASSARNVISGNGSAAVVVTNADASGAIVGNLIGTDVTGTQAIGNGNGIRVADASPAIRKNVIAGANLGVSLEHSSSVLLGNFIGTDESAALDLGNPGGGIYALEENGHIRVGGLGPGEANVIAHNGRKLGVSFIGGIHVRSPEVEIRGNRIFDNAPLGIDLLNGRSGGAVTPNDPGDGDDGPNGSQNFPVLTSAVFTAGATQIFGYLDSTPSTAFALDFFADSSCHFRPAGFDQGERYLGSTTVTTDASGRADFLTTVGETLPGEELTATATDPLGRTSEFSQRFILSIDPRSGPADGGTTTAINGFDLGASTVVTLNGLPVTGLAVVDPWMLTGTMPALPAGSVYDVVAFNPPSGGAFSLVMGWLSDFLDVPSDHMFHDYVVRVATNGIAAGVGGGLFGVSTPTTRQQMAVFLMKARRGLCFTPPPCTGVFGDVPCGSPFAPWVEALAAEGITGGCGGGNFCPQSPVRRDQMAVFLLKAGFGPGYVPPHCIGTFTDVPCPSLFADWVETLAEAHITSGCGVDIYCPSNPVTRGQMAVLITKTFRLP